jgi:hypothetical protein
VCLFQNWIERERKKETLVVVLSTGLRFNVGCLVYLFEKQRKRERREQRNKADDQRVCNLN